MNGEMYQISLLTAAVKKAFYEKSDLSYTPLKYENRTEFQLLPQKRLFITTNRKAKDVTEWYNYCLKKGLRDIFLLAPYAVKNRDLIGFANTTESSIVCIYNGGKVSAFSPYWQYDESNKMWNILYTEYDWPNAPSEKALFENNSERLKAVLLQIKELAYNLDNIGFADIFQKAIDILSGSTDFPDVGYGLPLPQIPKENLHIFEAASTADVFGGMGSWNDSPPYAARSKGLEKEYEELSNELFKQIRLAILYAINEW
jgi:hypothetical protein